MPYADSDFFVALTKPNDRLRDSALEVYEKYRGKIYTSLATIIELALISGKFNMDPEQLIKGTLGIAKVMDTDPVKISAALNLMKDGVSIFDAFHAALSAGEIISSDHIYDKIGIIRIKI